MIYKGVLKFHVDIPEDVKISLKKNDDFDYIVKVEGKLGEIEKRFSYYNIWFEIENNKLFVCSYYPSRKEKRVMKTYLAKVKNMIKGVKNGFEYRLRIVYRHFPMKVTISNNKLTIKNFMGCKGIIELALPKDVDVKIEDMDVVVKGIDIERVSQTAALIEQFTLSRARDKDRRKMFDGIYLYKKGDKLLVPEEVL